MLSSDYIWITSTNYGRMHQRATRLARVKTLFLLKSLVFLFQHVVASFHRITNGIMTGWWVWPGTLKYYSIPFLTQFFFFFYFNEFRRFNPLSDWRISGRCTSTYHAYPQCMYKKLSNGFFHYLKFSLKGRPAQMTHKKTDQWINLLI